MLSVKSEITERLNQLKSTSLDLKPRENGHLNYILDRKYAEKAVALSLGSLNTTGALVNIETVDILNGKSDSQSQALPSDQKTTSAKQAPLAIDLKSSSGAYVSPIVNPGKID